MSNAIAPQAWQISSGGCCSVAHDVAALDRQRARREPRLVERRDLRQRPVVAAARPRHSLPEQHGAARREAGTGHRQAQLDVVDLARRLAADLAHRLDDVAEAVDVRLAEVAAGWC